MKDRFGQFLYRKRRCIVRPYICGRLLDVGCGLNRLVREYGNGVGVDVYDWGDVDLLVDDTSCLSFPDMSFDTITCLAALNHIPKILQPLLLPMIKKFFFPIQSLKVLSEAMSLLLSFFKVINAAEIICPGGTSRT